MTVPNEVPAGLRAELDRELEGAVNSLVSRAAELDHMDLLEANSAFTQYLLLNLTPSELAAAASALALRIQRTTAMPPISDRPPIAWSPRRGSSHPHFCVTCSDGTKAGPGCINCRSTGMDQSPWPDCEQCRFERRVATS